MAVVCVGHMGMQMPHRLMPVTVAVLTVGSRIVRVAVMPVVVSVGVFVLQRLVFMLVPV